MYTYAYISPIFTSLPKTLRKYAALKGLIIGVARRGKWISCFLGHPYGYIVHVHVYIYIFMKVL